MGPTLEDRLRRLEDKEEIRDLLNEYGRTLDRRDLSAYSRLFAADGEWEGGLGAAKTPEGIRSMLEAAIGPGPPRFAGAYHIMSNMVISVDGEEATAWSRWTWVTQGPEGQPTVTRAGYYDDSLVREDGRWKFRRRVAATDQRA